MLKVEIEIDENKLPQLGYTATQAYQEIRDYFSKYPNDIKEITTAPKTLVFKGLDTEDSWSNLWISIRHFTDEILWFQKSVSKLLYYDSDEGNNDEDFEIENVLAEHRKKGKL